MNELVNGVDYAKIGPDNVRVGVNGNSPLKRMLDHPCHYQPELAEIVVRERPRIMIETGVESGFSSEHFLTAMDRAGTGHLYSCDPCPSGFYEAYPIVHPRFTFIRRRSQDALPELFSKVGPFDIFLHDSDHSWECQIWEFEFAWNHTRSGGIIASDDVGWGIKLESGECLAHGAWEFFCRRHGLMSNKISNACWIRRP